MQRSALLILPALVLATADAHAHAYLDRAEPRVGSSVSAAPRTLSLWFTQNLEPAFSTVQVVNAAGARVDQGKARIGGAPLTPKLAKRARVVARVSDPTSLAVTVSGDEATSASGILPLGASTGGVWNVSAWNTAQWVVSAQVLAEWEVPVPEIRARAFQVTLAHTDALRCDLRDFELRVQPSARETR